MKNSRRATGRTQECTILPLISPQVQRMHQGAKEDCLANCSCQPKEQRFGAMFLKHQPAPGSPGSPCPVASLHLFTFIYIYLSTSLGRSVSIEHEAWVMQLHHFFWHKSVCRRFPPGRPNEHRKLSPSPRSFLKSIPKLRTCTRANHQGSSRALLAQCWETSILKGLLTLTSTQEVPVHLHQKPQQHFCCHSDSHIEQSFPSIETLFGKGCSSHFLSKTPYHFHACSVLRPQSNKEILDCCSLSVGPCDKSLQNTTDHYSEDSKIYVQLLHPILHPFASNVPKHVERFHQTQAAEVSPILLVFVHQSCGR